MKNMKLLVVLLGIVLLISATYAINIEEPKADMRDPTVKRKSTISSLNVSGDSRLILKIHNDANWTRRNYEQEYPTSKIRTH